MNRFQRKLIEEKFKDYRHGMYNICLRMTGNVSDAEDVLHDAFIKAFSKINQLSSIEFFGPWLKRIVVNMCVEHLRKKKMFDALDQQAEEIADEQNEVIEASMEVINSAIQELPDGCRAVFNLYLLENYPHKEVAKLLGISESTSKSQYHRAKNILKSKLKSVITNG